MPFSFTLGDASTDSLSQWIDGLLTDPHAACRDQTDQQRTRAEAAEAELATAGAEIRRLEAERDAAQAQLATVLRAGHRLPEITPGADPVPAGDIHTACYDCLVATTGIDPAGDGEPWVPLTGSVDEYAGSER